jgi:hypothetical protein
VWNDHHQQLQKTFSNLQTHKKGPAQLMNISQPFSGQKTFVTNLSKHFGYLPAE